MLTLPVMLVLLLALVFYQVILPNVQSRSDKIHRYLNALLPNQTSLITEKDTATIPGSHISTAFAEVG